MAQSLVKLTLESNQYEKGIREAKRAWNEFTKGIGVSIPKFTGMAAAIGATTAALKVAKDAFFANEQQLDEWGRTVEASRSLYDGFLKSINNGDISGFLGRMGEIVSAAREAYNAMDELGTFNAFNQINTQSTRTNFMEAYAGYRTGEVSKADVQKAAKAYQDELRSRQAKEQKAYEAAIYNSAAKMGVPRGNLEQILSEYSYADFERLKKTPMTGKQVTAVPGIFPERYEKTVPANDTERMAEALRQLNDTELQSIQALGAQAERTGEELANVDKILARILTGKGRTSSGGSGGGGGGGRNTVIEKELTSQEQLNKLVEKYAALKMTANDTAEFIVLGVLQKEIALYQQLNNQVELYKEQAQGRMTLNPSDIQMTGLSTGGLFGDPTKTPEGETYMSMKSLSRNITEAYKKSSKKEKKDNNGEEIPKGSVSDIVNGVGSIVSGVQQLGVDLPEGLTKVIGVMQVITGILSTISTIVAIISATSAIPFFNRGGIVHAAGGFVPGNYGYDAVPAMLTSGEMVLNRAQQGNLASQLQGSGMNSLQLTATISGEQIRLALNNNGRRTGRGEYVTTNFR